VVNNIHLNAKQIRDALGGSANIQSVAVIAGNRVRVQLGRAIDVSQLHAAGVVGVAEVAPGVVHLIVGTDAPALAQGLQ
jgi:PTS system glucose-specific IIC component